MIASLTEVRWNHSVVLTFISFMGKAVEHLLMYLLAVCISSKDYPIHLPIY
jgi:hypothetical protein